MISGYTKTLASHRVSFLPKAYAPVINPAEAVASTQRLTSGPPSWFTMKLSSVLVMEMA